ncbi:hypothetical protein [Sphingomonas fuzhouensis]|uniref:hypothetical protein n=1 Tax=Sphingomonas fuzhouensis TaxID=3106033 RepID=UPI002AFE4985|nr:hypothetical protein [Sphingomonas sp. SGZ-02]
MSTCYAAWLLLAALGPFDPSEGGQAQETTPLGQQTAISEQDNSNTGRVSTGRILSRRETRIDTRITREKLIMLGQGNEAARTHEDAKAAVGRPGGVSSRF